VSQKAPRKPTIYTIAKLAGVSHTTVSRALNGHPKVSESQRKKIEAIADQLGFVRPNRHAIALRTKRFQMVGLLLSDFVNPYNSELAQGIDSELRRHGYACMVSGCDGDGREAETIARLFVEAGVDAIITNMPQALPFLGQAGAPPAVLISDAVVDGYAASVRIKVYDGTYQAVKHLVALGHRRIAHLGAGGHSERFAAYAAAMREAGLRPELLACGDQGCSRLELQERVERVVRQALEDPAAMPTAVVAHDDLMALTALQVAREMGLSVPRDLSIVGHDDTLVARLVTPRLSSISIPIEKAARAAARLALRLGGVELRGSERSGVEKSDGTPNAGKLRGLEGRDAGAGASDPGGKTAGLHCELVTMPVWRDSTAPPSKPA